ncbi:hypothetical protein F4775DRAFT_118280 [Biscogniauxia sp. FL1348]|nr:hypothetical protein F4775DRAFT_118280 [Biscogniauxia sp. FL1348]
MPTTFTPPLDALTTIFTPPCPTTWLLTTTKVPSQSPPFPTTGPASCDPPSWDSYLDSGGFQYYSPAICPSGFVVGPSCEVTNPRTSEGFPAIAGGETAAYCVPSGHTCTSDTTDFRGAVWGFLRTATASGAAVTVGPAIQIRWREADLANLKTDPLTPGLQLAQSTTSVQEPPPSPSSTTTAAAATPPPPSRTTTQIMQMTIIPSPNSPSVNTSPTSFTSSTLRTSVSEDISSPSSSTTETETPSPSPSSEAPEPASPSSSSSSSTTSGAQSPGSATQDDGDDGTDNANPITSSGFNIAAIALTATLLSVIQGYAGFLFIRRYRRYRAGHVSTLFPPPSSASSSPFLSFLASAAAALCLFPSRSRRDRGTTKTKRGADRHPGIPEMEAARWWDNKNPDAELGAEGPLPELENGGGASPLGSSENPAELGGVAIGVQGMAGTGGMGVGVGDEKEREREREREKERWSWRARVSRIMFSVSVPGKREKGEKEKGVSWPR